MRILPFLLSVLFLALPGPIWAQTKPAPTKNHPAPAAAAPVAPAAKVIGHFDDWQAATRSEAGQTVCYAFSRAILSSPAVPGRTGKAVLTVTQRTSTRDAVALDAGFSYASGASVLLQANDASLDLYTSKRYAFARDGAAAVAVLQKGGQAIARSPGPKGATITDSFSLKGFAPAYAAISKACPAK